MNELNNIKTRKRKSRFSNDVVKDTLKQSNTIIDPAAAAKAAALKISATLPTNDISLTTSISTGMSMTGSINNEQLRALAQEKNIRSQEIWKTVQEQINHLKSMAVIPKNISIPAGAGAAATAAALANATAGTKFRPAPLLLDELGRQIDNDGHLIQEDIPSVQPTIKANIYGLKDIEKTKKMKLINPYLSATDITDGEMVMDPRLKVKNRQSRGKKSFAFVQEGKFSKLADRFREKQNKKMLAGFTSGRNPRGYVKEQICNITEEEENKEIEEDDSNVPERIYDSVPIVEWWDLEYLPKNKRILLDKNGFLKNSTKIASTSNSDINLYYNEMKENNCNTSHIIEHPAKLKPISISINNKKKEIIIPLMLTKAERKRIRRTARMEREKEKQDKVALGLLPPPEPKVKLSNMMRVLTEQSVADPSLIEKKVKEQILQREKNHEMRNLAKKLTPDERRKKNREKIKNDAINNDIHVAVFYVNNLKSPRNRYKIDVNAQQYLLTGGVLMCKMENMNLVIVEGGPKSIKKYIKLMLHRIDWNDDEVDEEEMDYLDSNNNNDQDSIVGKCKLVWEGIVAKKSFNNFRFQECRTSITARKVMESKNVAHYWDLVHAATKNNDTL